MQAARPLTHQQSVSRLNIIYDEMIQSGGFTPFCENRFVFMPPLILFAYFMLPKSIDSKVLRLATWSGVLIASLYLTIFTRAKSPSLAALIGFTSCYWVLLATAHLLLNNAKQSYKRICKDYINPQKQYPHPTKTYQPNYRYFWETFPNDFAARYFWVAHLLVSINGQGWNINHRSIHDLPQDVQQSLELGWDVSVIDISKSDASSLTGKKTANVINYNWMRLAIAYVGLDLFKTITTLDPYFLGETDFPAPLFLHSYIRNSPLLVHAFRMFVAQMCMYLALDAALRLRSQLYLAFHTTSRTLGVPEPPPFALENRGVTGEGWFWHESFGPYSSVLDMGLPGFWGRFWHQSFRLPLEGSCKVLASAIGLQPEQAYFAAFRVAIMFALSGLMHAALSYTAVGHTRPILGPFLFFCLQPVGMVFQAKLVSIFHTLNLLHNSPESRSSWRSRVFNLVFANAWLMLTAPLFVEDLSRGGQFLFEPVPVSIFRGLGWANKDDGWLCWQGRWWE